MMDRQWARRPPFAMAAPTYRYFTLAAAALLGCCVLPSPASAGGPLDALRLRDREIREILRSKPNPGSVAGDDPRLRQVVNGILDYEAHTRASFGRHWDQLSEPDRKEAIGLISILLERSAMAKLEEYREQNIQYVSEIMDPAGADATVLTRVTRGTETAEISYRMHLGAGRWRIVDISVEGASSAESNRAAFAKEIRASGVRGLLEKLRRKAERKPQ
jgi:phospholipid transport system substrate-binding protein